MAAFLPMAMEAVSSAVSGGLNYMGGKQANASNRQIAREQMQFQERMSSTAYQRAVHDMEAAGINPILAYQQGGASSPGGASAQMQNELGPAVNSALNARSRSAEVENMRAQNKNLAAQNEKIRSEIELTKLLAQTQAASAKQAQNMVPVSEVKKEIAESEFGKSMQWLDAAKPIMDVFKLLKP